MYFGNRGVHPSVLATLTEGRGVKKPVLVESVEQDVDLMLVDLDLSVLTEGQQIDEGIMDVLKYAKDFFLKYWTKLKFHIGAGLPKGFDKKFLNKYIQDPKQAMGFMKQSLLDQGMKPDQVDKRIESVRRNMETAYKMKQGITKGARGGQPSKVLMAMANASKKMNQAQANGDKQTHDSIFKNTLGAVTSYVARTTEPPPVSRGDQQRPEKPETPAQPAQQPQVAQPQQVAKPQTNTAQPAKKVRTADGKFYDGQRVQVADNAGNVIQGRVKLVEGDTQQPSDDSDYIVVDQKGAVIGTEKSHTWEATDPSESPAVNPSKPDPARIKAGPSISQSVAAVQTPPAQPAQGTQQPPPEPPPAPAAVAAPTPPPTKPTTQTLASPAAPVQPAAVPKKIVTKPAPSRARKNP